MYESLLVAVDGSRNSLRAAKEALRLKAKRYTLISVITLEESKYSVLHGQGNSEEERILQLQDIINLYQEDNYELKIVYGNPEEELVRATNTGHYDLIVIGTRGLSAIKEVVMGSVSKHVSRKSEINVLIVK